MKHIAFYSRKFRLCEWPEEPKEGIDYWKESLGSTSYTAALKRYKEAVTSAMENGVAFADQEGVKQFIFKTTNEIRGTMLIWQPKEGDNWPAPQEAEIENQKRRLDGLIKDWVTWSYSESIDSTIYETRNVAVLRSESVEKKESVDIFVSKISYDELSTHELLDNLMCSAYYQEPYFGGFEEWRETDIIQQDIKRIEARLNQSTPKE